MPPILIAVAVGVGASLLGASLVGAILVGLSVYNQLRQQERLRDGLAQRAAQTVRASVESAKWRIGTARHFGMLSQIAWSGRDLQFTLVIGEAPIAGVSRVWVNGRGIDVAAAHGSVINLTADQALGEGGGGRAVRLHFFLNGAAADTTAMRASPWDSAEGLRWSADMQMRGLAFCVVYVTQDDDGSWWRSIPEVEFRTTGYMWAPPGETAAVITNAAQVRRWWEIERERETPDRIEATSYAAAVTTCTAAGYEIHGTIDAADAPESSRAALDFAWDGTVVEWNGVLRFLPGAARAQLLTIPASDILDLPVVRPARALHERTNRAEMRLLQSRTADWQTHSMPPVEDTVAQERDGGVLVRDYGEVEYVTDPAVATRTANRQMLESDGLRVELRVPYGTEAAPFRYLELAPGSIVGIDVAGLSGKRFRVDSTGPGAEDTLHFQLSEELANRYTKSGLTVAAPPSSTPEPPSATQTGAPTGLAISFSSIFTSGQVVTNVVVSGGGGTVPEGGGTVPGASASVTRGTIGVETERELVAKWDDLPDGEPAVGWLIRVVENVNSPDSALLKREVLDVTETEFRIPYRPGARYRVTLARVLPPLRFGTAATANGVAPADRTMLP